MKKLVSQISIVVMVLAASTGLLAQEAGKEVSEKRSENASIGGKEHNADILGVKIGMDIPSTLEAVFINAKRKPGEEKPDGKKNEGKDKKDIRIVYKKLPQGELQIVFANGQAVKEITLKYAMQPRITDLRLPYTGFIGEVIDGERFDDRYTLGYTDSQGVQGLWWREEDSGKNYKVRITFLSANKIKEPQLGFQTIIQKTITVAPSDEEKFLSGIK